MMDHETSITQITNHRCHSNNNNYTNSGDPTLTSQPPPHGDPSPCTDPVTTDTSTSSSSSIPNHQQYSHPYHHRRGRTNTGSTTSSTTGSLVVVEEGSSTPTMTTSSHHHHHHQHHQHPTTTATTTTSTNSDITHTTTSTSHHSYSNGRNSHPNHRNSIIPHPKIHSIQKTNHPARSKVDDVHDPLGLRILELVLVFSLSQQQQQQQQHIISSIESSHPDPHDTDDHHHWQFRWTKPICSTHNWNVIVRHYNYYYRNYQKFNSSSHRSSWSQMTIRSSLRRRSTGSTSTSSSNSSSSIISMTNIYHALLVFLLSLFGTTTVSSIFFTGTLVLITLTLLFLFVSSLDLLFDCTHHRYGPQCAILLRQCYILLDHYIFQGWQYCGRTMWYNKPHQYEIYLIGPPPRDDPTNHMNLYTPLYQLKHIPSVLVTNATTTTTTTTTTTQKSTTHPSPPESWSYRTTQHLVAIQYCSMVQQQYTPHHHHNNANIKTNRTVIVQSDPNATEVLEHSNPLVLDGHDYENDTSTTYTKTRSNTADMHNDNGRNKDTSTSADMAWIDVGAQIGLRLLHSEHVQRAMALQDTKERIFETMQKANHHHQKKSVLGSGHTNHPNTTTSMTTKTNGGSTTSPIKPKPENDAVHPNNTFNHPQYASLSSSISMDMMTTTSTPTTILPSKVHVVVPPKPIHTMWTSPGSAATTNQHSHRHLLHSNRNNHGDVAGGGDSDNMRTISSSSHPDQQPDPDSTRQHLNTTTTTTNMNDSSDNTNHVDDDWNDSIPMLRQSQSYPISPCSPRSSLLLLSSLQLPPLQSPSGTTTTNHTTNVPDVPLTAQAITNNTAPHESQHPIPDGTVDATADDISMSSHLLVPPNRTAVPRRSLSSHYHRNDNDNSNSIKGHFRPGRIHRRVPLLAGMKVAVPMSPFQPHHHQQQHRISTKATKLSSSSSKVSYMMSTVVRSQRIHVDTKNSSKDHNIGTVVENDNTNCLSVTVKLDKFFLRHGEFGELTFRVYDEWSTRYMPRHSKVPIGACVATSYGIGVLVGWRVEDDCHIVRSLWQCRGSGSAYAYMNRNSIHKAMVAANGFRVQTVYGWGIVQACVKGGNSFTSCRYFVEIREENSRHKGNVLELDDTLILSCHGAQFMPVIEHVRAAALYQIQLDNYNASLREQQLLRGENSAEKEEQEFLRNWSACADIFWKSFLKAVEEDKDFDEGVHDFVQSMIDFLDRLDKNDDQPNTDATTAQKESEQSPKTKVTPHVASDEIEIEFQSSGTESSLGQLSHATQMPGFWFMNDLFGGIFKANNSDSHEGKEAVSDVLENYSEDSSHIEEHKTEYDNDIPVIKKKKSYFNRAFAVLRTIMKTVSIARASSVDHPHFRLALAISYDALLFVRTILKIQQRNTSVESLKVWKRAWGEIIATFGPIQERLESIGRGIANRMEHQGRKAKVRVLKFVDTILGDERLLFAMEQGEWDRCLARVEIALVEAEVIEAKNLIYYRKAATFIYDHVQMLLRNNEGAAARNNEKLAILGHLIQAMAAPRRSILKIFCREDMLELFERILVRAYYKEEVATRMLTIHAATFHSLRHLRILKDFSVSGRIWIPLLDAADEELSWFVSTLPDNSKGIMLPVSRLFSLCVAQFHKINDGDLSKDWLAFLLEEESVQIIQEIDMLLILGLESFSRDIREMMTVLPYYASIDDDILNLMDEVNLDEFLKEAANAIDNPDKLAEYIREKATIAIERFLNYLPKMSIPVEKRELGDGWVLSCHGSDGGGLTLTDVTIRRENLVCQIMGGDTLFFPMFNDSNENLYHDSHVESFPAPTESLSSCNTNIRCDTAEEESVLDHIKILLLNAQKYGCWKVGFGGICQAPSDPYAASILRDIPISNVLNCSIELWRNLQIDDDELLEIAIRDISYHIQLQKRQEDARGTNSESYEFQSGIHPSLSEATSTTQLQNHNAINQHNNNYHHSDIPQRLSSSSSFDGPTSSSSQKQGQPHRFNPRVDPTVLFLEIKRLTLNLDNFFFRIEKASDKKTIFDPVFAGRGMLSLQNISIRLRVECAKERVKQPLQPPVVGVGSSNGPPTMDIVTPILQLRQLEVSLEKLSMMVKDTGFGSDWILNKAVEVFEEKLMEVVVTNLKDQIQEQLVQNILESLNSYFLINPNLLLNVLGISMDDLDENVVWV